MINNPYHWSNRFVWVLFFCTLFLILAGASVTSTDSGLAVPDWPLSFGQFFPPMEGGVFYEHGHRLVASAVGMLTVMLAVWLQFFDKRPTARRVGWLLVVMVITQGILGGITVLHQLPKVISISHAVLAQLFLATIVVLTELTKLQKPTLAEYHQPLVRATWLMVAIWVLMVGEIFLGANVRHFKAGLIIPDFPLAYGKIFPSIALEVYPVAVHYFHRLVAGIIFLLILCFLWQAKYLKHTLPITQLSRWLLCAVLLQIGLGAAIIWTERQLLITTLHVLNGAVLFAVVTLITTRLAFCYRNMKTLSD